VSDLGFQPQEEPESEGQRGRGLLRFVRWELFLVVLLAGTVAYGNHVSPYFLEWSNLFFICLNVGEVAIIALPLTLIVITGEIDLSVASILGLCGVVMAELFKHGWEMWPAMGVAVLLGPQSELGHALLRRRPDEAAHHLRHWREALDSDAVVVEVVHHRGPGDAAHAAR